MTQRFYLTTTLPYVNAKPHLGFAWEILTADFICRFQKAQGKTVIFNTGTDEHGQKIYEKATELGISPQEYVDQMAANFRALRTTFHLSTTHFVRTTDPAHVKAAQEMWYRCQKNGDIYQKKYAVKYCVGCELPKTESELVNGRCPLHPHQELEKRQEDNYFFRFSRYQEPLLALYKRQPEFVLGQGKREEIVSFVKGGLQDFSISRVREKMPWGVPVPGDDTQVMYVWFDALTSYISTLGWPGVTDDFGFWPGVQICGKDNLRQQAAMWQAMLLSAGLPTSRQILVNGFITVDGQKMSKSLGNVIDPFALVEHYGVEATRFLIASFPVLSGDVDITPSRLHDFYTAQLANGYGNLASRLAKLASQINSGWSLAMPVQFSPELEAALERFSTSDGLQTVLDKMKNLDGQLSLHKPWLIKDQTEKKQVLQGLLTALLVIIKDMSLFMPETATQLLTHFTKEQIKPLQPLFPRLEAPVLY